MKKELKEVQRVRMEACFTNLTSHNKNKSSIQRVIPKKNAKRPILQWRGEGHARYKEIDAYIKSKEDSKPVKTGEPIELRLDKPLIRILPQEGFQGSSLNSPVQVMRNSYSTSQRTQLNKDKKDSAEIF